MYLLVGAFRRQPRCSAPSTRAGRSFWGLAGRALSCQYYILVNYLCSHYRDINNYHQNTGRRWGRSPPLNELHARAAGFVVLEITYCVIIYYFITVVNNRIRHLDFVHYQQILYVCKRFFKSSILSTIVLSISFMSSIMYLSGDI